MKNKQTSLRAQFLKRLFIILIIIVSITSILQLYFINNQISEDVKNKSEVISQGIEQGMEETDLATKSIEHQIDLRLESFAKQISEKLKGQPIEDISADELKKIKDELGLTGITLFAKKDNDIVGVQSTEQSDIGFSFKKIGYVQGYKDLNSLYQNKKVTNGTTYATNNLYALPIVQAGSQDKPVFNKYVYYIAPGAGYIINPYIEANEVYQFTEEVGPESWINRMKDENSFIKEIAVLDPRVFENPELETKLFPPLKKVIYGEYKFKDKRDKQLLTSMVKDDKIKHYIEKYKNDRVYKMFLPTGDGKVIYIGLDYGMLSGPLYRHSIILIVSGLVSLLALFLLTARFFNKIYEKIQKIKIQIEQLESGDLTAKNSLTDNTELGVLSKIINRMVDNLNKTVKGTQDQASKTQQLSVLLEAEASQSVKRMYEVSTEATMKSRDQLHEITEFFDYLLKVLQAQQSNKEIQAVIENIEKMKSIANERTTATTDMTITLSDLLQSLHLQSSELSKISNILMESMAKFKV